MQFFCHLDNCVNKNLEFGVKVVDDCFLHHAKQLEKESKSLLIHYQALKDKFKKNEETGNRFERKYREEKKKNKELTDKLERLSKLEKHKSSKADFKDISKKSKPLGNIASNTAKNTTFLADDDSSNSLEENFFKSKINKKHLEKENSPKKSAKEKKLPADDLDKMSMALTFSSSFQPEMKRKHSKKAQDKTTSSSPKLLKQQKLPFSLKPSGNVSRSKTVQHNLAKPVDDNETFCESFLIERAKTSSWTDSLKCSKSKATSSSIQAKSPRETTPLFDFKVVPKRENRSSTVTKQELQETPDLTELLGMKQEKLSEHIDELSSTDLFKDADLASPGLTQGSVVIVEPEEEAPFLIEDTVLTEYDLTTRHERNFLEQTESPVIASIPPRKRKRIYAECRECNEFYDAYAERFGASQADEYIRDCPVKCKGFRHRKKIAEPPLPEAHSFVYRDTANQTPEGFWNVSITKTQDDDADRTQDGL